MQNMRLIREPLFHFLMIGGAIFAVFFAMQDQEPQQRTTEIVISSGTVQQLSRQYKSTWGKDPDAEVLERLIGSFIHEEVMFREALALGLDQGDAVVRQRLSQKMTFIARSAAAAIPPQDGELERFHKDHSERYTSGDALAFQQVFLGDQTDRTAVTQALAFLNGGGDPAQVGRPLILPRDIPLTDATRTDGTFGNGFFAELAAQPSDIWAGPVRSGYGLHLVRVTDRVPGTLRPFDDVADRVLSDWRADVEENLLAAQFEQLRAKYTIVRDAEDT
jgi:hypothetical protein